MGRVNHSTNIKGSTGTMGAGFRPTENAWLHYLLLVGLARLLTGDAAVLFPRSTPYSRVEMAAKGPDVPGRTASKSVAEVRYRAEVSRRLLGVFAASALRSHGARLFQSTASAN